MRLTSATPGASIGYRLLSGQGAGPWLLATGDIILPGGSALEAQAIRYGFAPSEFTNLGTSALIVAPRFSAA
ncbi:MAG: hypothetical protein R3E84_04640 [Pseudomonadales bacterium]